MLFSVIVINQIISIKLSLRIDKKYFNFILWIREAFLILTCCFKRLPFFKDMKKDHCHHLEFSFVKGRVSPFVLTINFWDYSFSLFHFIYIYLLHILIYFILDFFSIYLFIDNYNNDLRNKTSKVSHDIRSFIFSSN